MAIVQCPALSDVGLLSRIVPSWGGKNNSADPRRAKAGEFAKEH